MNKKRTIMVSLLCAMSLLFAACSPAATTGEQNKGGNTAASGEPIIIGGSFAVSGPAGLTGEPTKKGVELAISEINASGGIKGRPLKLISYDDEGNPEKAVQNVQRLIRGDKAVVVMGPVPGRAVAATQSVADNEQKVIFAVSGGYMPKGYLFNNVPNIAFETDIIHAWAKREGIKKIGVIATSDTSGDLVVARLNDTWQGKDGIRYIIERFGIQDIDVTPQLTRLKGQGIDALLVVGLGTSATVPIQNAKQLGFNMPILTTHANMSDVFAKSIKDFMPGKMLFSGPTFLAADKMSDENPLKKPTQEFWKKFKAAYGEGTPIHTLNAFGYDAMNIVAEALKKAEKWDGPSIRASLENNIKNFKGVVGVYTFTPDNHLGIKNEGQGILRLNQDLTWSIEWEPEFWKK